MKSDNTPIFTWQTISISLFLILFGIGLGWLIFGVSPEPKTSFSFNEVVSLSVSLVLGASSLILGVFAIWLTLKLKTESDTVNNQTKELLTEIKSDSKAISNFVFSEMKKWGDFGREHIKSNTAQGTPNPIAKGSSTVKREEANQKETKETTKSTNISRFKVNFSGETKGKDDE